MARRPPPYSSDAPPKRFPDVAPTAYTEAVGATYLVESMMQMQQSIGVLTANVDRLITDVGKATDKIGALNTSIDRIKTAIWVVGACLAIFLPLLTGLLWWSVGERINSVLRPPTVIVAPPSVK